MSLKSRQNLQVHAEIVETWYASPCVGNRRRDDSLEKLSMLATMAGILNFKIKTRALKLTQDDVRFNRCYRPSELLSVTFLSVFLNNLPRQSVPTTSQWPPIQHVSLLLRQINEGQTISVHATDIQHRSRLSSVVADLQLKA